MDKFLYRQKNTGFRQSDRLTVGRPDRDVIACYYAGSVTDAMPGLVEKNRQTPKRTAQTPPAPGWTKPSRASGRMM